MCDDAEPGAWDSGLSGDHSIEVIVTENPVIAVLLGPDGAVLSQVRERPTTFGFARWKAGKGAE